MSVVRLSNRLPRIAAGPFAATSGAARDEDWSEIEALLSSDEPERGRRRTRGLARAFTGLAAVIATGGLVLAGLGAAERAGRPGPAAETAAMIPSTGSAVPRRTQFASAPTPAAIEEGRSVATAASPPAGTPSGAVASIGPTMEIAPGDNAGPAPRRHRHKHRESRAGLFDWREHR